MPDSAPQGGTARGRVWKSVASTIAPGSRSRNNDVLGSCVSRGGVKIAKNCACNFRGHVAIAALRTPAMSPPPAAPQPSPDVEIEQCRWFTEEVHPHGAQLKLYLRKAFPSVRDVEDVVQESYVRIWKARAAQPIRSAKGFLFEVARRLAIDFTRHQARSPIDAIPDFPELSVIEDRPGIAEAVSTKEEVAVLARALDALPTRCREVMILRQIEGRSQKEIAAQLRLSELTVQTHVVQGLRRMRAFFRLHGSSTRQQP